MFGRVIMKGFCGECGILFGDFIRLSICLFLKLNNVVFVFNEFLV